ncbi:cytochrome P450 [Amycolatopsis antarctica]|uniref:Cytochrome P450 n=1 Tax=Amycolatopsis antarctica TaxID=1854586 RepID=A0A263D0F3_9PSEU|nr:cytochrome P450 [Amycolatopsis antarctica]OZM71902.1 cytochrome P450 [Amycolatopsis antarctica]
MTTRLSTPAEAIAVLVGPAGRRDPYPVYERLREHGNLVRADAGMLVALGYAECTRALREPLLLVQDQHSHDRRHPGWQKHSSMRGFTDSMLYTNPPDHHRMRALMTGAFTTRRIRALRPAVETLTGRLLDRMADLTNGGHPIDFMAEFAFRLPVAVIGELLGVPERDQHWFREVSSQVTVALEGISTLSRLAGADRAMDELSAYFLDLVEFRRRRPAGDLISALAEARESDGDRLTENELVGNLVLLLVAGFDTTTHLLGHGLRFALDQPRHAQALRTGGEDIAAGYVEETLRLEPPVQATSRWAGADLDLMGTPVAEGTKVLLVLAAANRDPARYPDAATFDPYRRKSRPLSFGGGMHLCLGAVLARMEAQIAFPALLRRFPDVRGAGGDVYRDRWLVRGHDLLPVTVD